ncbi:MAG: PDZ domain-containing protein [Planctomycetes bacterium]|nr:PDZ domain-containing protein [Planctomycetota bacterium]
MKLSNTLTLLCVAALPLAAPWIDGATAQETTSQETGAPAPRARRPPVVVERAESAVVADDVIPKRIAELSSADPKTREAAADALAKLGEKARAALQAAKKHKDAETRFAATQLLERLDQEQAARTRSRASVGGFLRESDEQPAESDSAEDGDSARGRLLRHMPGLFADDRLRELHQRMQERMKTMFDGADPFAPFFKLDPGAAGDRTQLELGPGSSFSRVVEQDGIHEKLSVEVDGDGRAKAVVDKDGATSTYEADSLEALERDHPELFEGFGAVKAPVPPTPAAPGSAPRQGPRLGIRAVPVDPAVAEYLELEPGLGLRVVEVVPGSAAAEIGVRRNDLLIEVNGRAIRGIADVQAALKQGKPEEADLIVIRKGQKLEL